MAAKLSERQKKNIVAAYAAGGVSYVELAKKYDVSKETVRRIIKEDSDFVKKCDTIKNEAEEEAGKDLADAVYDRQTMAQKLLDDILRSDNNKRRPIRAPFIINKLLRSFGILCYDLYTLVIAASLAYAVCKIGLAALRALYKVSGSLELPYAGTSFHLSRMRNLSLWYCHCDFLLCEPAYTHSHLSLLLFFISSSNF